jgi:hypothetical protein
MAHVDAVQPGAIHRVIHEALVDDPETEVRRPLNREGFDQWRPFEPWLGPLRNALGSVLDAYPDAPPA